MFTIAFNNFFADTHLHILSSFILQQASFKKKQFTDIAGSEKRIKTTNKWHERQHKKKHE